MEEIIIVHLFVSVFFAAADATPIIELGEQNTSETEMTISHELEKILPRLKTLDLNWENVPKEGIPTGMEKRISELENTTDTDEIFPKPKVDVRIAQKPDTLSDESRTTTEQALGHTTLLRDVTPDQDYLFYRMANGSFKLHRTPATWIDARLICYDEGAELASPEDEALLATMSKVLLTSRQPPLYVFTGINDLYSKGFFSSVRGTPLAAMPARWAPEEPDNVNHGDNCLLLQRNGLLHDGKCDDVYPFICYKRQTTSGLNFCGTDTDYIYDKTTKSCYKFHTAVATWHEAYATCSREAGHLAIANSDMEAKALSRMFPKDWGVAAIGFSYWRKDLWVTIHGETLSAAGYETWGNGEPNDWQVQRCGAVFADGTLDDIGCLRLSGYICEKKSIWI